MQKVIECLNKVHDEILAGQTSRLDGKVGGIVITGDSDGAQYIIENIANFLNATRLLLPPFATWQLCTRDKLKKQKLVKKCGKSTRMNMHQLLKKWLFSC
jgi:hypothetical protein